MGQPAEQTALILDKVAEVVDAANPDVVASDTNYWWLLLIALIPPVVIWWLNKKK